jgi:hypothetical protein
LLARPAEEKLRLNAPWCVVLENGERFGGQELYLMSKAKILQLLPPVCELNGVFPETEFFLRLGGEERATGNGFLINGTPLILGSFFGRQIGK